MDPTYYNRYKHIKEQFNYAYKGYNLQQLIPGYIDFVFSDNTPSARDVFKAFYVSSQSPDLSKIFESKHPAVISLLINRTDYKDLVLATQMDYPDSEIIILSELPTYRFSFLGFKFLKNLILASRLVFGRSIGNTFLSNLYFIALTLKLLNQINLLEKNADKNHITQYICFNSAYKEESALTVFFNKRNIETISLQHGIFSDFKMTIPFDQINFDNLIAQKLLCWGQSTIDYLTANGFDQSRLILKNNPKYKNTEIKDIDQSFTRCLVLLGRGIYVTTNDKLLSVLKEYNQIQNNNNKILFYIKKHPFLMDENHKQFASINDEMIFIGKEHSTQEVLRSNLVNFTIAVNTTAYYESLALGKPSLRWTESENEVFFGMDDKFENVLELQDKIKQFREIPKAELQNQMKEVIKYVFNPEL